MLTLKRINPRYNTFNVILAGKFIGTIDNLPNFQGNKKWRLLTGGRCQMFSNLGELKTIIRGIK